MVSSVPSRHTRFRFAAPLACAFALGCRALTDPPLPGGAERLVPPPVYARWWAMAEACSGVTRPLGGVAFYRVPGAWTVPTPGQGDVAGYWSPAGDRVVLAGAVAEDGGVVRHEMLHALVRAPGHPRAAFLGGCAGVVDCTATCLTDAGPAPAPASAAVPVGPDELEVTAEVAPAVPSLAVDGGLFTFTVRVRNPKPYPVVVVPPLPPPGPFPAYPVRYQVEIAGPAGGLGLDASGVPDPTGYGYAAGETRRRVYDLSFAPGVRGFGEVPGRGYNMALGPGRYALKGGYGNIYGTRRSDSVVVALGP